MRILVSILFMCILFGSCKKDKELASHDQLIEYLSKEGSDVWPSYSHIIIFCKCDNQKVGYLDVISLRKGFNIPKYNELGYSKYISEAINLDLEIDSLETDTSFTLNDTITSEYNNISFDEFLKKYTTRSSVNSEYQLLNGLSYNSTLTILYYLYQNNYYSYFDDIAGLFYSRKGLPPIIEIETDLIFESH
ncbi:MAG: hypothetical protein QM660_08935 [Dysgonomonas sp.]